MRPTIRLGRASVMLEHLKTINHHLSSLGEETEKADSEIFESFARLLAIAFKHIQEIEERLKND